MSSMYKKRKVADIKKDIPISFGLFRQLSVYLISRHRDKSFLTKLANFYENVNTTPYSEDGDISIHFEFSKRVIGLIQEGFVTNTELILDNMCSAPDLGADFSSLIEDLLDEAESMSADEAIYLENEFISRGNMIALYSKVDNTLNTLTSFKANDFGSFDEIVQRIQVDSSNMLKAINAKSSAKLDIPDLILDSSDTYNHSLNSIIQNMNSGSRKIKTGVKWFNNFIYGGFEPSRVYVAMAITGGFKSGWMLNTLFWACKYNDDVKVYDQLKRPAALYLNIENDNSETMERVISYVNGVDEDGKSYDAETINRLMREEKLIDNKWLLGFLYRKKGTVTTGDIDGIINNFEFENNCEVKILVVDYLKRIGPAFPTGDLRIDLGEVVNDLSILAKSRRIVVITANQLNRGAYEVLQSEKEVRGKIVNNMDGAKRLTNAHASESSLIVENADCVFAINKEESRMDGKEYLTFKMLKNRSDKGKNRSGYKPPTYFVHPFEEFNSMRLQEDINLDESLSLVSIESTISESLENDDVILATSTRPNKSNNEMEILKEFLE